MLIYNITLISQVCTVPINITTPADNIQERDWGRLEYARKRIRTTLVAGESFEEDYLLQLPKRILYPTMAYSVLTHWMLGEALQTQEAVWLENADGRHVEHSRYNVSSLCQCQRHTLTPTDHLRSIPGMDSDIP